jgi:hypothetical protein
MSASTHRLYHRLQLAAHHLRKTADRAIGDAVGLTTAQVSVYLCSPEKADLRSVPLRGSWD